MKKGLDARRLDVRRFAEEAESLEGSDAMTQYPRLMVETDGRGSEVPVTWSARGEMQNAGHHRPQVWLHLEAHALLPLVCQRCLGDVDMGIDVKRSFRFVPDEQTAAAEDDESDEDVLAESRSFDLLELIEDELLMGLPVAPRHTICPVQPTFSAGEAEFKAAEEKRPNPFAVLQAMKPGKR